MMYNNNNNIIIIIIIIIIKILHYSLRYLRFLYLLHFVFGIVVVIITTLYIAEFDLIRFLNWFSFFF